MTERQLKIFLYLLWLLPAIFFSGCRQEELLGTGTPGETGAGDTPAVGFVITLPRDLTTREGIGFSSGIERYENYIDIENKFKVLFFNEAGDFLFSGNNPAITALNSQGQEADRYYIRIPVGYIVDAGGNLFPEDRIRKALSSASFKIAVLANWPDGGEIGSSDFYASSSQPEMINSKPDWGWEQSILNTEATDLKNINELHHLTVGTLFNSTQRSEGRPSMFDCFDIVMAGADGTLHGGNGLTSQRFDWVRMREPASGHNDGWKAPYPMEGTGFRGQRQAENWIRQNWSPSVELNDKKSIYRHYSYLWNLWNFDAVYYARPADEDRNKSVMEELSGIYEYDSRPIQGSTEPNRWGKDWWFRNGKQLKDWLETGKESLKELKLNDVKEAGFAFTPDKDNCAILDLHTNEGHAGILLPSNGDNRLSFILRSSGTLRIKFSGKDGENATLKILVSEGETTEVSEMIVSGAQIQEQSLAVEVTGQPQKLEILSSGGNPTVYSIEYLQDQYLYLTDREGVVPDAGAPIPMYGVQNFGPVDFSEEEMLYDLSEADGRNIALLRSVAKVIVYLKNQPSHIYLRGTNRTSRCEPVDVETPTSSLWKAHSRGECEWFDIFDYGASFINKGTDSDPADCSELSDFTNRLSWNYGSWTEAAFIKSYAPVNESLSVTHARWDFSSHNVSDASEKTKTVAVPVDHPFPHLFNPDFNHNDFCHFIYDGFTDEGYHKYVLYVPENNISEPSHPGTLSSRPLVPHIEYRYPGFDDTALDDNRCHRIYFTDYQGIYGSPNPFIGGVPQDQYESHYELNLRPDPANPDSKVTENHLDLHWPIMRNHVYEFYIDGDAPQTPQVRLKISDWGYKKIQTEW